MEQVSYGSGFNFTRTVANLHGSDADRSKLLRSLAFAVFVGLLVVSLPLIILSSIGKLADNNNSVVVWLGGMLLVAAGFTTITSQLIRMGQHQRAMKLFLYGTLGFISLLVHLLGGVGGPMFVTYLIPVMAAGLFGQIRQGVKLFIWGVGIYVVMAALEVVNVLHPVIPLEGAVELITFVVSFAVIGGITIYVGMLWSSSTVQFAKQFQEQSEALFDSNQKLMDKNYQQVELGSELSAAAAQLLTASHQQASGATQQASAVSEVSTTIEELGSTARQIAIASEQVAEAAQQTLENLSEGQDAVDSSIQAMDRIRTRMHDISTRVLNLGERSQQIGEIIDLINDLSDETHLLALNAAIEAAGAGEHGRRFAVVAAEVKNLANRALAAAKEVKGVIAEIQQATNSAVLAAEEGGKEVERGVELAHRAGQVMDAIVMVAERTAQSGAEISLATAQQQSASEQVVETMREIADVARQTASGARQMAEAAQTLTAIAERLHGISISG